jgi:pyruvate dehydrogenase E2 component (dihydrolipoamide acetyltransferase)
MAVEVFMSKMSDHMEEGEIIQWLVKEGDRVEQGQVILEVQTDKAVAELEASASGILKGIRAGAEDGATIPVGETFAFIAEPDEDVPVLPPLVANGSDELKEMETSPPPSSIAPEPASPPVASGEKAPFGKVRASPVSRRVARELGVDLAEVTGTGPGGRITEEDVRGFVDTKKSAIPRAAKGVRASPVARRVARELGIELARVNGTGPEGRITEEDVRSFAETVVKGDTSSAAVTAQPTETDVEWVDLTTIQRLTGRRMLESVQTAPHFALATDVDMTDALWLREALMERVLTETDTRLSITAILIKVVAAALQDHPRANASFEGGRVKLHRQVNVGVAVGTTQGLVVPVIREATQKSLIQITQALKIFQEKAEQMRFSPDELSGGTFTISNLGMYGVDRFNAIINPPESAILAVGRIIKTPLGMPDDTIALRPLMSLTLSVDHRSLDGVQGAKFLANIKERLEKPYFLL